MAKRKLKNATVEIDEWFDAREGAVIEGDIVARDRRKSGLEGDLLLIRIETECEVVDIDKTTARKKVVKKAAPGKVVAVDSRAALDELFRSTYRGFVRLEFGAKKATKSGNEFMPVNILVPEDVDLATYQTQPF